MPGPANVSVCDVFSDDSRGLRQLIMENDGKPKKETINAWFGPTAQRHVRLGQRRSVKVRFIILLGLIRSPWTTTPIRDTTLIVAAGFMAVVFDRRTRVADVLERLRQIRPLHRLLLDFPRRLSASLPRLRPGKSLNRLRDRIVQPNHRVLSHVEDHWTGFVTIRSQNRHIDVGNARGEDLERRARGHREPPPPPHQPRILIDRIRIRLALSIRAAITTLESLDSLESLGIDRTSLRIETLAEGDPKVGGQVVGGEGFGQGQVLSGWRESTGERRRSGE